jgi:hypothetical protein
MKNKNIFFEATDKTPMIDFNQLTGELILSGKSIPENAAKIYEPLLIWTQDYIKDSRPITNIRLNLEYFNTATSIWISKIIKALCGIEELERVLFIHVYFNIEDFNNVDDVEEDIVQITNALVSNDTLSISIKLYGTDENGNILKESMVFI